MRGSAALPPVLNLTGLSRAGARDPSGLYGAVPPRSPLPPLLTGI